MIADSIARDYREVLHLSQQNKLKILIILLSLDNYCFRQAYRPEVEYCWVLLSNNRDLPR